ncbi:DnaB-like helicase N-terminal domain-containing protein [Streptomyces sp. M92]|uniref:DnaB-like helicase N-terminal domain-containing protein n=1 Tax=Streptomyces sp. M92 TaxID=2944250 RepID=UPI00234BBBB6|nr:DnaB-like helicase N-terminal domain-containing protein [Streptomyces sp. M92]WCN01893.1 hypothetical protein M6G08_07370 [Streptomyces sp. M92]
MVELVVEQLAHRARPRLVAETEVNRFKALWDKAHASASTLTPPADESSPQAPSQRESPSASVPSTFLPGAFAVPRHQLIYQAITDLHRAGKPVGVPQVSAELERRGQLEFCGGEDYLFECVKSAIKGAYEAGMSLPEFAVFSAQKVRAAAKARAELATSVQKPGSDTDRTRRT